MSGEISSGEEFSTNKLLKMEYYKVLDSIVAQMKWRFEKLSIISDDFDFLSGFSLSIMSVETLKKTWCRFSNYI